jgi:hypothetical protein
MTECFFAGWPNAGPCDGRLIRAHLIPQQKIKRAVRSNHYFAESRKESAMEGEQRAVRDWLADERGWVPCCGGPMGLSGHHGALDVSRKLRIAWEQLPPGLVEFATELDLLPWLERTYPKTPTAPGVDS